MLKIVLNGVQDVPLNRLVLSQANVRRIKAGVSIEDLAEDIARRGLLQSLSVRPVLDGEGLETGSYEVPAGGRRFEALKLLAKQKRLSKTVRVPCIVRTDGIAEEDSLAENTMREALHPLDQFRAFQALRTEHGMGDEEIAARFFVTPAVVRQRLKLVAASPKLLDLYAAGELTLEQLMAFCLSDDHARQEQVWDGLSRGYNKEPYTIRRLMTENAVKASDRRAVFVGITRYESAGGAIARDLLQQDHGGWFEDPALLDRLVGEKLDQEADAIRSEGWRWVQAAPDFPYGHTSGLRRLASSEVAQSEESQAEHDRLRAEYEALETEHANSSEDLPEEVDARLGELETALARFEKRPRLYDPAEIARAGAFVSLDYSGALKVERGFVRPEDEAAVAPSEGDDGDGRVSGDDVDQPSHATGNAQGSTSEPPEEEDGIRPLPERLLTELTAHRTLALRDALASDPEVAYLAVLHALALKAFYRFGVSSCLEIEAKSAGFTVQAPGLADTASAKSAAARHQAWADQMPTRPEALWDTLAGFDRDSRDALFAYCAALTVNAVQDAWNRAPGRLGHADQLANALRLDMAEAGWAPTTQNYLGRVTKARILQAVCEAKGEQAAQLIDHLKKPDMAKEAERLLADTGWLPEPLRTTGADADQGALALDIAGADVTEGLPAFLADDDGPERRIRLLRPMDRQAMSFDALGGTQWREGEPDRFAEAWAAELADLPEFSESSFFVVTGLLLPIWRRLPDNDGCRVYRLQTDDGERIIGRLISPADVDSLAHGLGLGSGLALSVAEAFDVVLRDGASLALADGLQVRRSTIMGAPRIELLGFTDGSVDRLKAIGLSSEIISWKLRLFVPTGECGPVILGSLLERHPLLRCIARPAPVEPAPPVAPAAAAVAA